MSEAIIAALISGGITLAICLINNEYQQREVKEKHDSTIQLIEYKIGELTTKVEKHNNLIERTIILERDVKTAYSRIDELRDDLQAIKK